jgi:hypothetical protein
MATFLQGCTGPTGLRSRRDLVTAPIGGGFWLDWALRWSLLGSAGSCAAYIDGSFVTDKDEPGDFDGCWDVAGVDPAELDPVFLIFENKRAAQKARFLGEFFPAQFSEGASGRTWLDFFQVDKNTGEAKGIVAIDLRRMRR